MADSTSGDDAGPSVSAPAKGEGAKAADAEKQRRRKVENVNAIEVIRRRVLTSEPEGPAAPVAAGARAAATPPAATAAKQSEDAIPEDVRERFRKIGRGYHFADGTLAFTDRGTKLVTTSENTEVIRSIALIAKARDWEEIRVRGTETFRREAWASATALGIEVRGYKPTEAEQVKLAQRLSRSGTQGSERESSESQAPARAAEAQAAQPPEARRPPPLNPKREGQEVSGTLLAHGRAPYQHSDKEAMSYFVKLDTGRGERTVWGVDLERAFRESVSKPRPGDEVTLRAVRREPVTVKTLEKDPSGETVPKDVSAHRNRWQFERKSFVEGREKAAELLRDPETDPSKAARAHPDLMSAYVHLRGAELLAKEKIGNPEKRKNFLTLVRNEVANIVGRGEALKPAYLKDAPVKTPTRGERDDAPVR